MTDRNATLQTVNSGTLNSTTRDALASLIDCAVDRLTELEDRNDGDYEADLARWCDEQAASLRDAIWIASLHVKALRDDTTGHTREDQHMAQETAHEVVEGLLLLALTAPTDEQAEGAAAMVDKVASTLDIPSVERAKAAALARWHADRDAELSGRTNCPNGHTAVVIAPVTERRQCAACDYDVTVAYERS